MTNSSGNTRKGSGPTTTDRRHDPDTREWVKNTEEALGNPPKRRVIKYDVPTHLDPTKKAMVTSKIRIYDDEIVGKSHQQIEDTIKRKMKGMLDGLWGQIDRIRNGL